LVAPDKAIPTDRDLGLSKRLAARARKLAELGRDERKALEAELKVQDKAITPNAVLALHRLKNKQKRKAELVTTRFSADGPFDVVVIDPPWHVEKIDREVRLNQDAFDYPTMSTEQLIEFWAKHVKPRLKVDVHVFLWTTNKYLPTALDLLKSLDLRYVLTMVWHKAGGFQPVDLPQFNCEFVVYARLGSPLFIDTKSFFCCFDGDRREHSRKPDEFYDTIRRVTGGSRIDVFSREAREGFAQGGNELDRFLSEAAAE
jgi:N6-adenosine-specific RNA methylase IME4